jgi:hypothetical protein
MQFFGMERHSLANGERSGVMVDAEGKNHRNKGKVCAK